MEQPGIVCLSKPEADRVLKWLGVFDSESFADEEDTRIAKRMVAAGAGDDLDREMWGA